MRILVVNPNTTSSMTARIGAAAEAAASPGVSITALNPGSGPASIEGFFDEAMSLAGLIETVQQNPDTDAIVLACFDDTGLDAVRCMTNAPVIGIGEAAFHAASFLANKFSVVTTLSRSVPAIEHNLLRYGLAQRCAKVRASEVPVLDLENNNGKARKAISTEIRTAIEDDRAEAIVLGCAGMTDLAAQLSAEHGLPVVDGIAAAICFAESLVRLGLKTSSLGGYAPPTRKSHTTINS